MLEDDAKTNDYTAAAFAKRFGRIGAEIKNKTKGETENMSKAKLGFCTFSDGYLTTDVVAPKSQYPTKEDFLAECIAEYGEDYTPTWSEKVKIENVIESHCRYFPTGIEGWDGDGGCYSFSKAGIGAFPVWRIELQ